MNSITRAVVPALRRAASTAAKEQAATASSAGGLVQVPCFSHFVVLNRTCLLAVLICNFFRFCMLFRFFSRQLAMAARFSLMRPVLCDESGGALLRFLIDIFGIILRKEIFCIIVNKFEKIQAVPLISVRSRFPKTVMSKSNCQRIFGKPTFLFLIYLGRKSNCGLK
jgi:hypothetical protein